MSSPSIPATGSVQARDGVAVVTVSGHIDISTVGRFQALIDEAIAVGEARVSVDMSGVDFIDGQGIRVLAAAAENLRARGGRFSVTGTSPWMEHVLDIARLNDLIEAQRPAQIPSQFVRNIRTSVRIPETRKVLDAALKLVVTMAQQVVAAADGVSITLPRDGVFVTVASSNAVVLDMDHDQYETGEGPCLDAATLGGRFMVESLREETRWPLFAPRALARGIESILSTPLVTEGVVIGALNVYSRRPHAFAAHESRWTDQFAAEAAAVVSIARADRTRDTLTAQIEQALQSREVIALAQGIVMHRDGLSKAAAHEVLRLTSQNTGRPLRDVCEAIVRSADPNQELPDGGAHGTTTE